MTSPAGTRRSSLQSLPRRRATPELIEAARRQEGITRSQADALTLLYRTRDRLQHASPDIRADEVHEQVTVLLRVLPGIVSTFVAWMAEHDVELA